MLNGEVGYVGNLPALAHCSDDRPAQRDRRMADRGMLIPKSRGLEVRTASRKCAGISTRAATTTAPSMAADAIGRAGASLGATPLSSTVALEAFDLAPRYTALP